MTPNLKKSSCYIAKQRMLMLQLYLPKIHSECHETTKIGLWFLQSLHKISMDRNSLRIEDNRKHRESEASWLHCPSSLQCKHSGSFPSSSTCPPSFWGQEKLFCNVCMIHSIKKTPRLGYLSVDNRITFTKICILGNYDAISNCLVVCMRVCILAG